MVGAAAVAMAMAAVTVAAPAQAAAAPGTGAVNDYSCTPSAAHPDPVVMLHGTFATEYEDINFLAADLAIKGYCVFTITYGAYPNFPVVGGLKPIAESSVEIKNFILDVVARTGAAKADIVGHSEGALQSLYVTKLQGISDKIGRVVAIAPPTNGTTFLGLFNYGLEVLGRDALDNLFSSLLLPILSDEAPGSPAVTALHDGPVAQPGVNYTIITSKVDEVVTPPAASFVDEPGVTNQYVQDFCPGDGVGHIGEAYDLNVWHLVENALDPANATPITQCSGGVPL